MSTPFPSTVPISDFRLRLNENKARSESVFTRQRQVVTIGGGTSDRWEGNIITPALFPATLKLMMNWMHTVGLYGEFTIGHPDYSGPDSGETLGAVVGAGQSGNSLDCDGFTPSITVAEQGDYIQVRNQFLRLSADAVSNISGEVTFSFTPALRVSPADNDPVDVSSPVILCELLTAPEEQTDQIGVSTPFNIAWQEVLSGV